MSSAAISPPRGGRATERMVAATAIGLAGVFVALTVIAIVLPGDAGLGPWLPVHLLLAGAAATAIAGMMPFFSVAIANAQPAPGWLRVGAVVGVASGTFIVVGGRIASPALAGGDAWIAGLGGLVFILGTVLTGAATLLPLQRALGRRRIVIGFVYGAAVVNVAAGATLGSLLLLGWLPALQDWPALKPAHAWLNVFGFVSLVIAGTLLHLLPTVLGTRIPNARAPIVSAGCLALGPAIAALGFIAGSDVVALLGAGIVLAGSIALALYAVEIFRHRFSWRTDHSWHRFTTWSLLAAVGWFVVSCFVAARMVLSGGAAPAGWLLDPLVAPLLIGWVAQVLVGAWSHLVPAVGPGLPARHAVQRRILGWAALARLAMLNVGVLLMVAGQVPGFAWPFTLGLGAVVITGVVSVALLAGSLAVRGHTATPER
jgi:hypothetical protein